MANQESQIFTGSEKDREAELKWLHERKPAPKQLESHEADTSAREVIARYREHMPALFESLKKISFDMRVRQKEVDEINRQMFDELVQRGVPQEQALLEARGFHDTGLKDMYERLRERLTNALAEASALSMEMSALADGVKGSVGEFASGGVKQEARATIEDMDTLIRDIELAFNAAITGHNEWTHENTNKYFGKRDEDYDKFQKRKLTTEFYDERAEHLMELVGEIEEEFEKLERPSQSDIAQLLLKLDDVYITKLGELNDQALPGVVGASREGKMLVDMIGKLRARITGVMPDSIEQAPLVSEEQLPELELLMTPQEYEEQVGALAKGVLEWEKVADRLNNAGKLTPDVRRDILDELRKYPAQLYELDEKVEDPNASPTRVALIETLKDFRNRLNDEFYISERRNPSAAAVSSVRNLYHTVKASYASVQHTLTLDQRRDMRVRIASLASLVRRAEEERASSVRAAVADAVSHAFEHAPAVALASVTNPRK